MISTVPAGGQVVTQAQIVVATETPQIPETPSVSALLGSTVVSSGPATTPDTADVTDEDKNAIYRHPLFPLMALLLEKCEQATQSPDFPPSDSFDVDIQSFVANQEQQKLPFFSDDPQLDSLMVKAIQVLRIHLLELEKVNELCKDFCKRYIACLKGKLHSEHLLRNELGFEDDDFDSPPPSSSTGTQVVTALSGSSVVTLQSMAPPVTPGIQHVNQPIVSQTVYQMVQTPQGLVAQPIQVQQGTAQVISHATTAVTAAVAGSTPMSQIGVPTVSTPSVPTGATIAPSLPALEEEEEEGGKKRSKRGVLPKQATQVMRSWLFQHIVHPYPTEDEKRQIAQQTNLTLLQVNNWFINARRRILQPMLDAGNPDQSKAKKTKPQTRPAQRFWPDALANLQPQSTSATTKTSSPATVTTTAVPADGSMEAATQQTVTIQSVGGDTTTQQIILPAGTFITADGRIISSVGAAVTEATHVALTTTNTAVIQAESQTRSEGLTVKVETEPSPEQQGSGNEASTDDSSGDE